MMVRTRFEIALSLFTFAFSTYSGGEESTTAVRSESGKTKGVAAPQMISALVPIPPGFISVDKAGEPLTMEQIFVEITGQEMVAGAQVKTLPMMGSILVHHFPEAVEKFQRNLTGEGHYLPLDEAFAKHTSLGVFVRCLRIVRDPNTGMSGKMRMNHPLLAGRTLKIPLADLRTEEVGQDFQLGVDRQEVLLSRLRNLRLSARFDDPEFFADSCLVEVGYPVPDEPGLSLLSTAHFVPGEEQLIYVGSSYVAAVTVYLFSDFPIPNRATWEGKHGTRLDDYDWKQMVFSFEKGRTIKSDPEQDRFNESESWDFLYEPNHVGLAAFHPDVTYQAREPLKKDPFAGPHSHNSASPAGDLGGICDLGDVPLHSASVPEDAQFVPAITDPRNDHTYAIRNRQGALAGFIRTLSIDFSKGDASSMRFHWRRADTKQ